MECDIQMNTAPVFAPVRDEILRYNTALRISIFSAAFCNGWASHSAFNSSALVCNEHNFPPKPCSDEPDYASCDCPRMVEHGEPRQSLRGMEGSFPPSLGDTMVGYGFSILIECPWFDQYTAPMLEISKEIELALASESESELFTQEGVWPAMPVLGFLTLACCSGVERECE